MLNKKKQVGITLGVAAGVAAVAASAVALYKRYKSKGFICSETWLCCDECEMRNECECYGKYHRDCRKTSECFVEEGIQLSVEDFEK